MVTALLSVIRRFSGRTQKGSHEGHITRAGVPLSSPSRVAEEHLEGLEGLVRVGLRRPSAAPHQGTPSA
eukprot:13536551-Alexandrium_andersonii.AAC.1